MIWCLNNNERYTYINPLQVSLIEKDPKNSKRTIFYTPTHTFTIDIALENAVVGLQQEINEIITGNFEDVKYYMTGN